MEAQRVNLVINQGAKLDQTVLVKDRATGDARDLTGFTARMQARTDLDAVTTLFDLNSEGVGAALTLGGVAGTVRILIPASATTAYTWEQGRYDLKITPADVSQAERVLQGYVVVKREVTHE